MKNTLYKKSVVSIEDLSDEDILLLFQLARDYKKHGPKKVLEGKVLASCFFEPSTRTRLSFESAALQLGAQVIGFSDANTSSHKKGESLYDSMKVMQNYADAIVLRHPREGSSRMVSEITNVPTINAGDGANQHPTQALLDLFTIKECQPEQESLNIVFMGDLRHGRTVHSLAQVCRLLRCRLFFVAEKAYSLPDYITDVLKSYAIRFSFHHDLREIIDRADILYVTRLQQERLDQATKKVKYGLRLDDLKNAKPTLKILHPLPRVDEIDTAIDNTPYAYYFQQAADGLYIRQALLTLLLCEDVILREEFYVDQESVEGVR